MKGKLMNTLKEKVNRIQELRRSNAATAIPSKKKYNRKQKYKNKLLE
jgi:vacuolar-type H+-ATPase subunit F/Vma7